MSERKLPKAEQIERRAYELYLERDGEDSHDLADWLSAERELTNLSEQSASTTARALCRCGQAGNLTKGWTDLIQPN
jgi:DUF2934 family protein